MKTPTLFLGTFLRFVIAAALLTGTFPALRAAENADSTATTSPFTHANDYRFSGKKLIAPVALTVAGAVGVGAFTGFKQSLASDFQDLRGTHYWHGDDYIQYAPAVAYLALGSCGVKSRNNLRDRLMAGITAYMCMAAIVNTTKFLVDERRPESGAMNSFPSGHSATVFLGAELMRIEYGNAIGAAGYAVAAGVGFLRMYNGRHWYNDILAGAGIGILCARIGYWLLPLERKLFKFRARDAVVMPYYSSANRNFGVSFAASF